MFVIHSDDVEFIINALRVAAETYRKDATVEGLDARLVWQFNRQAERAEDLALKIEVEG